MNKHGINGLVHNSVTPIDKEGIKVLNVNQFQPNQNDDYYNMGGQYNQQNTNYNMEDLNNMEENLVKQMGNMNLQRKKLTPPDSSKKHKEKRNSSAVLLAKNNIVHQQNNENPSSRNSNIGKLSKGPRYVGSSKGIKGYDNDDNFGNEDLQTNNNFKRIGTYQQNTNKFGQGETELSNKVSQDGNNYHQNTHNLHQVNNQMGQGIYMQNGGFSEKNIMHNNYLMNQNMLNNQKMINNTLNAQRKNLVRNAMMHGKPDVTQQSKQSAPTNFGSNFNTNMYNMITPVNEMLTGGTGSYSQTPIMGMNGNNNQLQNMGNFGNMGNLGNMNNLQNLGLNLEGGLYKNETANVTNQQMLNVGQNIINMNMQQQINMTNNANYNNLFSHPSEENYTNKHYNLTDQNDFRGRKGNHGYLKSAEDYGKRKKFTPYSIRDFKELSRTINYKVGGLGANLNDDWLTKKRKAEKIKEFSDVIKEMNIEKISNQQPKEKELSKQISTRERALEFSKNIPKPKIKEKSSTDNNRNQNETGSNKEIDTEIKMIEDHLGQLEMQHQYYQNKITSINS